VLCLLVCCQSLPTCGYAARRPSVAEPATTASADTAIFSAVVSSIQASQNRSLYVDPRPIRGDAVSLDAAALTGIQSDMLDDRRSVLQRLKVPTTNAVADLNCGIGNMRAADPQEEQRREMCRQRQSTLTIIMSLPDTKLPSRFHSSEGGLRPDAEFRTLRVLEISAEPRYGSHAFYDYVVMRASDRTWTVVWKDLLSSTG